MNEPAATSNESFSNLLVTFSSFSATSPRHLFFSPSFSASFFLPPLFFLSSHSHSPVDSGSRATCYTAEDRDDAPPIWIMTNQPNAGTSRRGPSLFSLRTTAINVETRINLRQFKHFPIHISPLFRSLIFDFSARKPFKEEFHRSGRKI